MQKFYVYMYLDPRKEGNYSYATISLPKEPFYVGKGIGRRFKDRHKNRRLNFKLNKLKKLGMNAIKIILIDNLSEQEAFDLEKQFISEIGRANDKTGPLLNVSDGGDGGCLGYKWTPQQKVKLQGRQAWNKGKTMSEEHCQKLSKIHLGVKQTQQTIIKRLKTLVEIGRCRSFDKICEMRARFATGNYTKKALAIKYNMSQVHMCDILNNKKRQFK